jgi:sugar phosphate isomerase/epimerase
MVSPTLAVSSWSWHDAYYRGEWSLLDQPATAVASAITTIECNDFMLPPPRFSRLRRPLLSLLPGAPPELWRYSRATLHQLKAAAEANGVTILAWTVNSDFTVPARHWPAQQLYLRRGLAAARLLQAPLLRLNLGGSVDTPADLDGPDLDGPDLDGRIIHRLTQFVHLSQRYYPGLCLTVENHWGISTDIDRHLRLVDAVTAQLPPPLQARFGCCFDPANMPPDPSNRERWWRELAARANHYHLKTTTFDDNGNDPTLPHSHLFTLLHQANYHGPITIEFTGDGPVEEGIRLSAQMAGY